MPRDADVQRARVVDPSRWVSLAAGLVLLVGGAIGVVRSGIGRFPAGPTVEVWGLELTPLLAILTLLLGAFFCVAAADPSRAASTFTATFGLLGGATLAIVGDDLPAQLLSSPRLGWTCVVLSTIVLVSDLTVPAFRVRAPRAGVPTATDDVAPRR